MQTENQTKQIKKPINNKKSLEFNHLKKKKKSIVKTLPKSIMCSQSAKIMCMVGGLYPALLISKSTAFLEDTSKHCPRCY